MRAMAQKLEEVTAALASELSKDVGTSVCCLRDELKRRERPALGDLVGHRDRGRAVQRARAGTSMSPFTPGKVWCSSAAPTSDQANWNPIWGSEIRSVRGVPIRVAQSAG